MSLFGKNGPLSEELVKPTGRFTKCHSSFSGNHPSGDPAPSEADTRLTREIVTTKNSLSLGS